MTWIGFIPSTTSSDGDITGVTAGSGMTGGGTTGAVTLNLIGGDGITANANDMAITAAQTTITSVLNTSLVIGRDADNDIDFATDNQIIFRVGGADNVIFKASGEIEATSLDISGDADIDGTMEADAITLGGVTVLAAVDEDNMASNSNTLVPTQQSVKAYVDASGGSVSGNTFATDLKIGRDADNLIDFTTDNEITFRVSAGDGVVFKASGEIEATKFDGALEGNADTATTLETARTIGGVSFDGSASIILPGVNAEGNQNTSGNAATASHILITDNESTNEENQITFIEDAGGGAAYRGLEADGDFTYNPSNGTVSATIFKGNIDAVDGDFDGTLEVDNLTIGGAQGSDGQVLTSTGSGVAWEDAAGGGVSGNTFATDLKIGRDADNLFDFTTDNQITLRVSAADGIVFKADNAMTFGHASSFIEGAVSGNHLIIGGNSDISLRIAGSTKITMDGTKCEFSIPPIPTSNDAVALGNTSKSWSDLFLASGGVVNFNNGDVTVTHSANTLTIGGGNLDTNRQLNVTSSTHFEAKGDIIYLGSGSTTQGELCYLTSGGAWAAADANATGTAGGVLLALALGTDPDADGMLLRGMFTLDHDPGTIADELYVSTTAGDITGTAPSGSGDIVRVVGYCMDSTNGQIWFNPSNDFIVLA